MKHLYSILIFLYLQPLFSQSSIGFIDNYSGIESVLYNPANILDTHYKLDLNILSISGSAGNNYYSINPFKILSDLNFGFKDFKPTYNVIKYNRKLYSAYGIKDISNYAKSKQVSSNNNLYGNVIILGPSFLWSINPYNAVAFTTSIKTYAHAFNLNTKLFKDVVIDRDYTDNNFNSLQEIQELIDNIKVNEDNFSQAFSWAEVGFSYAGIIKRTAKDFLKFGVSVKLLRGIRTGSIYTDNLKLDLKFNELDPMNSSLDLTGKVTNSYSQKGANFGMGLDLGFVYEKRNKTIPVKLKDKRGNIYFGKAPYLYKIGVSITDLGYINFNNVITNADKPNNINIDLTSQNYIVNIQNYLGVSNSETTKQTYFLPTTARFNFDYNINNKWYINSNIDFYTLSSSSRKQIKYISNLVISSRYETKYFSAFLPITINKFGVFKTGLGFKTGCFYLGSSSLLTNFTNFSKEGDLYISLKIPVNNFKLTKQKKKHKKIKVPKSYIKLKSKRI